MYTTEKEIQDRIDVIDQEVREIKDLKSSNRLSLEDIEDVSDNYQYNLEWNYLLSELQEERDFLIQERNKFHLSEADFWDGDESDNFLQSIWKEIKSFDKKADDVTFYHLLPKLGYEFLAYKAIDSKSGIITRRKYLVISPSKKIVTIVLGKTFNIISITSK